LEITSKINHSIIYNKVRLITITITTMYTKTKIIPLIAIIIIDMIITRIIQAQAQEIKQIKIIIVLYW
jgi:hypothetical protein